MDWFDPTEDEAAAQVRALNHALKMGGRVLLRSASIDPWYIEHFQENGFKARRVSARFPGTCVDRYVYPIGQTIRIQVLLSVYSLRCIGD